eukprot:10411041-Alexandrium_andersonii.AAC.1
MPQDPAQLQRQRDLLRGQSVASNTMPAQQPQPPVDTRPTTASRMQLEGPLREVAIPTKSQADDVIPDINDIEPEEFME